MIRHRPHGLGHAYRLEPDQRLPANPVEGDPIILGATTGSDVTDLAVELTVGGQTRRLPLGRVQAEGGPVLGAGAGHLAAAAARLVGRGRQAWSVRLDPLVAGTRVAYRFVADGRRQRTRRFGFVVAGWSPAGGRLAAEEIGQLSDRIVADSVAWLRADGGPIRVRFALHLAADEHVVGFGERFDHLDQRGRQLDVTVFEQYKAQGARSYMPMPFAIVVGGDGWGFHVRTSRRSWYDIGLTDPDRLWVEVELDPDEPEPEVGVALYGGDPADVLGAFLRETGVPRVPPDWVFRPWMSANEWNTEARVRAEVERSLAEGIPVGAVVIEAWSDETTFVAFRDARYMVHEDGAPHRLADFEFPPDGAWPDPKGLVDWLHENGIRLLLWQIPLHRARPAPTGQALADRETMVARGYGIREADGRPYRNRGWWFPGSLMPDFTNPEAKAWWLAKRRYLVEELGIDGFKTDGGEHAWGHDLRYADGTRGDVSNNRYPVLYEAAYHELMGSCGREPVTFSRAGFTGAASVPLHWAGDEDSTWAAFRASIVAGLTAGASGVFFWGWDIAGFSGEIPSAELYVRATAMAALCPIMQYHSEFNHHRLPSRDRTPWNIAERTGDRRVIGIYRRFARLRERLVPYLADQGRRSAKTSRPLMRALCFDWPADAAVWDHPFEYLLGDDLLVAPVTEPGMTSLEVHLPAGRWIDAWTGDAFTGPQLLSCDAPLESIPVFIRETAAGSLLPLFADE
ncbi:MAG TPA: TIM-barrel domain-containing protein [Patescibacteria group bacterium]|nr:TIM-barrel domain-containing protein [Patescibacteria group bacterium]